MNILYIGDVMGEVGVEIVENVLPALKRDRKIDLVVAQVENVTNGKGITPADFERLRKAGVDFGTGGNHSLDDQSIIGQLNDPNVPIIRPANMRDVAGLGFKYVQMPSGKVLVISLLGQVVGKNARDDIDNPLKAIDEILGAAEEDRVATVINFHGDYSSEKVIIGHYLDGRVSMVVGDHWHVPTADARVLPGGTAHITDVGMCGALDSSLGVTYDSVIPRWRDAQVTRNVLETTGQRQFNAVLVNTENSQKSNSIEYIRQVF